MSSDTAVGLCRTYVRIPENEPFTYESWCRNLRAGRTFMTTGPLLDLQVEERGPGRRREAAGRGAERSQVQATRPQHLPGPLAARS